MQSNDFIVVIPARYASTRLPGKALLPIAGKPMVEHVWLRARESGARRVIVATDDERVERAVRAFGGEVIMTSADHASGTDRLAEVARKSCWSEQTIVVNLQGDEPMLRGALVARTAQSLRANPEAGISTLAAPIREGSEIFDPNVVKVVLDERGFALYFSRAPIPWVRACFAEGKRSELPEGPLALRHFGLYGYRAHVLEQLARTPVAPLEAAESLEQLRALSTGTRIFVDVIDESLGRGVDTPADLIAVEKLMLAAASS